jgi:hypothetical protein
MACILGSGYSLECRNNTAGVDEVFIRSFSGNTTYSYDSNGVITGSTAPTGGTYYRFAQRAETANFMPGVGEHNIENGTNMWAQTLDMNFTKYQASLRNLLYDLALAELDVIVKTQNGTYFRMGEFNGSNLTASNASVGKAYTDLQGATVTLTAREPKPAAEMSSTFFASLTIV